MRLSSISGFKQSMKVASKKNSLIKKIRRQKVHLLLLIPFIAFIIIFKYVPMYGALLAFREFSFRTPFGGKWVGFKYFESFFTSPDFFVVMRNTIVISSMNLVFSTIAAITFAILICEVRNAVYKKWIQTVSYLPHFISWVVVAGMAMTIFSIDELAPVNSFLIHMKLFDEPINFLGEEKHFWPLITGLNVWKNVGWNSIIYIAAITSIDKQIYESAMMDGASKFRQIFSITLPTIMPTIILLFTFGVGYILNAGLDQQLFLQNPMNIRHSEVLDTYVLKYGLQQAAYSYGAAVGLFKSVAGLALLVLCNYLCRKFLKMGIF
ncbi:putative aldouronate transport system permease protein [Paenibacillus sp. UNCCL117]|uniref:ABC transporter permease n=1 Tax=unclassified Paenibacillus TaxID=185978 RepID=UPI00088A6C25|nr:MULTISPECIES: ABC transporter permease subunit [unclassified Paenibacillus]SDC27220.1 putative aldouronate transport system permease protein [Paenibacillus sp. cl123]SFW20288.1 putative aldouronate transport system permease protein [Paenibacillus sp. UNCCL117]